VTAASRTASAVLVALVLTCVGTGCQKEIDTRSNPADVDHQVGVIGQPVDDFGIHVTVLRIDSYDQSSQGFPRLLVTIRSESTRSAPWQNPDLVVQCDGSKVGGDWFDTSTWEPSGALPAGQVAEGQVIINLPSKLGATRYPVATCANARVVLTGSDPEDQARQMITSYPIAVTTVQAALEAQQGA
jgi:hypothetical protein